jgi:hypothetical protein
VLNVVVNQLSSGRSHSKGALRAPARAEKAATLRVSPSSKTSSFRESHDDHSGIHSVLVQPNGSVLRERPSHKRCSAGRQG